MWKQAPLRFLPLIGARCSERTYYSAQSKHLKRSSKTWLAAYDLECRGAFASLESYDRASNNDRII